MLDNMTILSQTILKTFDGYYPYQKWL